ncbi:MAG: FAD binding domain-containing protein [Frankiaceae bacterium]|nr:FAD binding domain-containing protein [Frankiaceae bacterium]
MIPPRFDYLRANSVEHALALLAEHGDDAKLLAGGHSLLPMMKVRLAAPAVLIDLGRVPGLDYIRLEGGMLAIGALTRHAALAASDLVGQHAPLLRHAAGQVGDPQVRHRGTIGGSLVHADPAADLPMAAAALEALMVVQGPGRERVITAEEFFLGYFTSAVGEDEILVEVRVPSRVGVGWGYEKFVRRANDWAIVGVAAIGAGAEARVALGNMAPTARRARATEAALAGGASIADAAALADEGTEPQGDIHAAPEYRRHLAKVLTRRALESAAA